MFDEMEDQKCMILKMFYSDILELLILFKNHFIEGGRLHFISNAVVRTQILLMLVYTFESHMRKTC